MLSPSVTEVPFKWPSGVPREGTVLQCQRHVQRKYYLEVILQSQVLRRGKASMNAIHPISQLWKEIIV